MSTVGNRIVLKASLQTGNVTVSRRIPVRYTPDLTFDEVYSLLSQVYEIERFAIYYTDENNHRIHIKSDGELRDVIARLKKTNGAENKLVIKLQLEKILKTEPVTSVANNTPDPVLTPDSHSNASDDTAANTDCDNVDNDHPFERVINNVMKNVQDIFQNIVQPARELSDDSMSEEQANDISSETEFRRNSFTSSISSSTLITETQEVVQPPPYFSVPSQIPSRPPRYSVTVAVHHGIKCDVCNKTIRGMRWKCKNCRDYDLCQQCKSNPPTVGFHPATHEFQSIPYPLHNHVPTTTKDVNMHSAICDFCESVILGTRHKCINCPDFDLCSNCVALAPTQHPTHTFMQIRRPGEPEIKILDSAHHLGIKCDHCNKQITGLRYKCGNCSDFDLCGNCEASPVNDHDKTHVFLKIRRPTPNPIISHEPLLPNLYAVQEPISHRGRYGCYSRCYFPKSSSTCNVSLASSQISQPATNQTNSNEPVLPNSTPSSVKSGSSMSKAPIALYNTKETHYNPIEPVWKASVPAGLTGSYNQSSEQEVREPSSVFYKASFVGDVNVPDGTVMVPQAQFVKIWRMKNDGPVAWPESTVLQFVDGNIMFNESLKAGDDKFRPKFPVGAVEPGQTCEISADLQAPAEAGEYLSYWRLVDGEGNRFGSRVWCKIDVEAIDQYSSLSSSSMIFPVPVLGNPVRGNPVLGNPISDNPVSETSSLQSSMTSIDSGLRTSDVEHTDVEHFDDDEEDDEDDDPFRDPEVAMSTTGDQDSDADSTEVESQGDFDAERVKYSSYLTSDNCNPYESDEERGFVIVNDEMDDDSLVLRRAATEFELQDNATRDENAEYANELRKLKELGFTDREKNTRLLKLHNGDLKQVKELLFIQ